jgi:hypothetical protein
MIAIILTPRYENVTSTGALLIAVARASMASNLPCILFFWLMENFVHVFYSLHPCGVDMEAVL